MWAAGCLASAVAMDKDVAKRLFAAGRPAPDRLPGASCARTWRSDPGRRSWRPSKRALAYPLFVKPANLGSSVGISKARDRDQLAAALDRRRPLRPQAAGGGGRAPRPRDRGERPGQRRPRRQRAGRDRPGNEFYDYNAKYLDDNSELLIPAPLDRRHGATACRTTPSRAFKALDCAGLARVDFLVNGASGEIF